MELAAKQEELQKLQLAIKEAKQAHEEVALRNQTELATRSVHFVRSVWPIPFDSISAKSIYEDSSSVQLEMEVD
eukprot:771080-Rhodomonas_salina.1